MDRLDSMCAGVEEPDAISSTQSTIPRSRLRQVQGTLIVHFTFAIQQDQVNTVG